MTKVIVLGPHGKMGAAILNAITEYNSLDCIAGVVASKDDLSKDPYINVPLVDRLEDILIEGSVVIDFTRPEVTLASLPILKEKKAKTVIGTTGFSEDEREIIYSYKDSVPLVFAPNMSVGVNILFYLVEKATNILKNYDIEIIEAHHHHKKDSPSGTALSLLESVAKGLNKEVQDLQVKHGREGFGVREKGEIGMHAIRGGDIVGDHTVLFAEDQERIELKHVAHNRSTFAHGACKAASFLSTKSKDSFTMVDILGL